MKKYVLLLLVCLVITTVARAQREKAYGDNKAFEKSDILLAAGASFGYFGFYGSYTSASIPVIVAVEYGLVKYVSLGGFVSYQSYAYSDTYQETIPPYNNVPYDYVYSAISMRQHYEGEKGCGNYTHSCEEPQVLQGFRAHQHQT